MSLNWNIEAITERKGEDFVWIPDGDGGKTMSGRTECMIWATLMVDLGQITEKNAEQFFARITAWEAVNGCMASNDVPTSWQDVQDHIGLRTNVADISEAKFQKKLFDSAKRKAQDAIRRAQKEAAQ